MWLQLRLMLLIGLMFAIIYGIIVAVAAFMGIGGTLFYIVLAFAMLGIQYMIGPKMVELSMRVKYVSESEEPELHRMVAELAERAGLKKPKVGISQISVPNAFAFGKSRGDGRICVTRGIMGLLSKEELRSVLGHEMAHIKNRDVAFITILSAIPMALYYIAWSFMWSRGNDRDNAFLIGIGAFILYFITNLLVLYGSRIREYYADRGSVELGNKPHALASALYKLVYGSARANPKELKQMDGMKAFFANDPNRAVREFTELKELDKDFSGHIDKGELESLRNRKIKVKGTDKFMEVLSTHPNMIKRIHALSALN